MHYSPTSALKAKLLSPGAIVLLEHEVRLTTRAGPFSAFVTLAFNAASLGVLAVQVVPHKEQRGGQRLLHMIVSDKTEVSAGAKCVGAWTQRLSPHTLVSAPDTKINADHLAGMGKILGYAYERSAEVPLLLPGCLSAIGLSDIDTRSFDGPDGPASNANEAAENCRSAIVRHLVDKHHDVAGPAGIKPADRFAVLNPSEFRAPHEYLGQDEEVLVHCRLAYDDHAVMLWDVPYRCDGLASIPHRRRRSPYRTVAAIFDRRDLGRLSISNGAGWLVAASDDGRRRGVSFAAFMARCFVPSGFGKR